MKRTNWKKIAEALAQDVNFALGNLRPPHGWSGFLVNHKTGKMRHWKERFADSLEMIPGVEVDREAMHGRKGKK